MAVLTLPAFAQKTSVHATSAVAPVPDRITQAIDETKLVTLGRNTRPEANATNDRGLAPDGLAIDHMFLLLQRSPEQEQELDTLIEQMNDKSSPNFHQWLSAAEFGQRFGVATQDIATITGWLGSHGFRVNKVYPSRILIDFSGAAGQIREAFHTEIHNLDVNGVAHLANVSDPQIPEALAPVVKGIASLNDFKPEPMYRSAKEYTVSGCADTSFPTEPGTNCYFITPQDNQAIYGLNPLYAAGISGQGQTIVLVEDTDTFGGAADWNTYRSTFGLTSAFPAGSYTQAHPGGCTDPGTNADDGEAAIDVEVASAIAPSAAIELISCPSSTFTFGGQIALQNLINAAGPYPGVVSVSYGQCEAINGSGGNALFYNTYQQAASEGVSVFVSSGDAGPSGCSRDFTAGADYDLASLGVTGWGETPYNVSVGGTDFEDTYNVKEAGASFSTYWSATNTSGYGSALSYIPEIPWNDACASVLISEVVTGSFTPYGLTPAICNNASWDTASTYLSTGAGSGGASNCATGAAGTNQTSTLLSAPECQGYAKPSWQSAYGVPSDGVRDIPDVSMFAANGVWGHYEVVCWSDTSEGGTSCSGAPSTWSGFGGTSVASPTMAAIQALVNQKTGQNWGNPNPIYYQIAQGEYGTQGGSFLGSSCNSSGVGGPASSCAFNDVTQGDIDLACRDNGSGIKAHCYLPAGTNGVDSTDSVTAATVINGGTGYTAAPTCTIAGPTNVSPYLAPTGATLYAGGTQATCTAGVNSGSTNAVWSVAITGTVSTSWANTGITVGGTTYTFVTTVGSIPNSVLLVTSGTGMSGRTANKTNTAQNLEAAVNANSAQCFASPCFGTGTVANASATATAATGTVTLTAKTAAYAGNFNVAWSTGSVILADDVAITNTTPGQGPNYVSGITIGTAGSGYQPETPITLTGGGGSGAIAVANTSIGTAPATYQPAYGAAPGYDLATGLGTPNANALVNSCAWFPNTPGISSPVGGSTFTGTSATFKWNGYCGATAYWLDVGKENGGDEYFQSGSLSPSTFSQVVNSLPLDGSTVVATWYYFLNGSWTPTYYSYTAFGGGSTKAIMSSPVNMSTLTGSSVTFQWNAGTAATAYWLDVGSVAGGDQYYQSGSLPTSTLMLTVNGLPTNGSIVYATLYSLVSGSWLSNSYSYTAYNISSAQAVLTTPTPNTSTPLTGTSVTFQWTLGTASNYWIDVGSVAGGDQYFQSGSLSGSTTQATVSGLPSDGSTIYVTLYSLIGGQWYSTEYTYVALSGALAVLTSPAPGNPGMVSGCCVTFQWTAGQGATAYWLDIGMEPQGDEYFQSGSLSGTSVAVNSLPGGGATIYATLYTLIGGQWSSNVYVYTSN